jgi:hypothetical protein
MALEVEMSRLRGPTVPILLILAILLLDFTSYRKTIRWQWPVVRWTMYETKTPPEAIVKFQRFIVEYSDGRREEISLGRAFAFLERPYRLDRGLEKNRVAFLERCLRELRRREGERIVGLTYEQRWWHYLEQSYEAHLDTAPDSSFRVRALDAMPAELRAERRADGNLVTQGDFRRFGRRSGMPRAWKVDALAYGVGVDLDTDDTSFLLGPGAGPPAASQDVTAPAGPVRLVAIGLASEPGAALELSTASGVTRVELPPHGVWHAIEARAIAGADGAVRVTLVNASSADAFFDDVALYAGD